MPSGKSFYLEMMKRFRLKHRALFYIVFFMSSCVLFVTNFQQPAIHNIVTETQRHLTKFKKNFKEEKKPKIDKVYLHFLGFADEDNTDKRDQNKGLGIDDSDGVPRTSVPWSSLANITEPVIISVIQSGEAEPALNFLKNIFHLWTQATVILFDIDMSDSEVNYLLQFCNGSVAQLFSKDFPANQSSSQNRNLLQYQNDNSGGRCFLAPLDPLDLFPSIVKSKAYRPLAIQQAYRFVGHSILWLDLNYRLTTGNLEPLINATKSNGGVATWLPDNAMPTSSLTHPKMLEYLVTQAEIEEYNFQHMVEGHALLIFALPNVAKDLMLPWVQCALVEECLSPIGAQWTGCKLDKKPQFRYSGCHSYDVSALNVILGQMFEFDERKYISKFIFFSKANDLESNEEIQNSTSSTLIPSEITN